MHMTGRQNFEVQRHISQHCSHAAAQSAPVNCFGSILRTAARGSVSRQSPVG